MGTREEVPIGKVWAIILAGGEGERVKPLVHRWLGRHRPKQYCSFVGTRSMLQHALDRAARLTSPHEIVIVAARGHEPEVFTQLSGRTVGQLLFQPANRETAAGIFFPLTYIRARDPQAIVVLYPSDHFVYPEDRFLTRVRRVLQVAEWLDDRIILLGVKPDRLELDYGWIKPDSALMGGPIGQDVLGVRAFLEKPGLLQADEWLRNGALWNTLVLASKVETLWGLGRRCFPDVMERFDLLGATIGRPDEARVLEEIYVGMPKKNFSSDLLERVPAAVAAIELDGVLWSDWGKPERIAETLRRINRLPAFPLDCLPIPYAPRPALHKKEEETGPRT